MRITASFSIFLCAASCFTLTACSKQDTDGQKHTHETTYSNNSVKDANLPQSSYSKISLPDDFPADLPLPDNIQLETYQAIPEDQAGNLTGLLAGKMRERLNSLHAKMLEAGWKANLVMPQGTQTLMHYTKDKRNTIIELNESVGNVVSYSLSFDWQKNEANTSNK